MHRKVLVRLFIITVVVFNIPVLLFAGGFRERSESTEVYFESKRGGYYGLYMQTAGQTYRLFNSGDALQNFPGRARYHVTYDLSKDGRLLAYSAMTDEGSMDIFLIDLALNKRRNLTGDTNVDLVPIFSNDGKWISYLSHEPDGRGYDYIFIISLYDGQKRKLTYGFHRVLSFSFSPDDREILFVKYFTSRSTVISCVSTLGGFDKDLTSSFFSSRNPAFNGEGNKIVYTSDYGGNFDIWIMNRDGSGEMPLYKSPGREYEPIFTKEGDRVVFLSDFVPEKRGTIGGTSIFSIDLDGKNLLNLVPAKYLKRELFFSDLRYFENGNIYYFQGKERTPHGKSYYQVYTLNIESSQMRKVVKGNFDKMNPRMVMPVKREKI